MGHEDRFPLVGRSVGCPFGNETYAEASGAKDAPPPTTLWKVAQFRVV
jgi:hypothetical protein